jgi:hypothetical protein
MYVSPCKAVCVCTYTHVHMSVCFYFLWSLPLGSCTALGLQTPGFTFSLLSVPFVGRSRVRKQAPRGFNHFAIKAELLLAFDPGSVLEEGLGAGLACPRSPQHTTPTSDSSRCKMEHSSLILPLNQGTWQEVTLKTWRTDGRWWAALGWGEEHLFPGPWLLTWHLFIWKISFISQLLAIGKIFGERDRPLWLCGWYELNGLAVPLNRPTSTSVNY